MKFKKSYNSLSELKEQIEKEGKEKITEFCGHTLTTNKNTYRLYDNKIIVTNDLTTVKN